LARARVPTDTGAARNLAAFVLAVLTERGVSTADAVAAAVGGDWSRAVVVLSSLHVVGLVTLEPTGAARWSTGCP
jgi:predicted transcriptional regulator